MTAENHPTTASRTAQCGCGGLTATVRGEPVDVYGCSCLACQRKSGSAFSYAALFPEATVTVTGPRTLWRHRGDSGRWIETMFCPTCGVTIAFTCEAAPGLVGMPVGGFADPDFAGPRRFFWGSRRHRWLPLPAGIEALDTQ
jgi:hypothetical protein